MAMSFDQSLEKIYKERVPKMVVPNQGVTLVTEKIINLMKEKDSTFKELFVGLTKGNLLDRIKVQLPNDFDFYMILNFPFQITPREDSSPPGSINLYTRPGVVHPLVHHNRLCRQCLQDWIRKTLTEIIGSEIRITVNSEDEYDICYGKYDRGYGVSHTIQVYKVGCMRINFIAVLEFDFCLWSLDNEHKLSDRPWLALPFGKKIEMGSKIRPDEYSFMTRKFHWKEEVLDEKPNLEKSLFLMSKVGSFGMDLATNYVLRTVYQWEVESRSDEYWDNPIGVILIEMLDILIKALRDEDLPFFFDKQFNEPVWMRQEYVKEVLMELLFILKKLRVLKDQENIKYEDVPDLFCRSFY